MDENLSLTEQFEKEFLKIQKKTTDKQDVDDFEQFESELMIKIKEYEEKNNPGNP